jgi:ARG/rhodanese/phosphatase superfamily protein
MRRANWYSVGSVGLALGVLWLSAPWTNGAQKVGGSGSGANELLVLDPVRYENLSVFPVVNRQVTDTAGFATLDEGLSAGEVVITESGAEMIRRSRDGRPMAIPEQRGASVNQLVLINRGSKPLLLLAGELVSGGKQDRIIAKDRIVPPGAAPLPLDVFCVENGRWSAGVQFSTGKMMVHPSVREQAAVNQEQDKVWAAVRNGTMAAPAARVAGRLPAAAPPPPVQTSGTGQVSQTVTVTESTLSAAMQTVAPTQSYEKLYKSPQVAVPADTFTDEVQRRFERATAKLKGEAVVGVVVAYGGDVAWSDVFASPSLFERYWPKLLRSYVVEALVRPKGSEQPSADDAREFLKPLVGHESVETVPAIYSLRQVTEGKYVEMELQALKPADITLHVMKVHRTS